MVASISWVAVVSLPRKASSIMPPYPSCGFPVAAAIWRSSSTRPATAVRSPVRHSEVGAEVERELQLHERTGLPSHPVLPDGEFEGGVEVPDLDRDDAAGPVPGEPEPAADVVGADVRLGGRWSRALVSCGAAAAYPRVMRSASAWSRRSAGGSESAGGGAAAAAKARMSGASGPLAHIAAAIASR